MRFQLDPLSSNGVSVLEEPTIIRQSAGFAVPGKDGKIQSIKAGTNVTIDSSDPANPVISSTGGGGGSGITRIISVVSSNTSAGSASTTDYTYIVSGTTTITLPTAVGNTNRYTITSTDGLTIVATTSAQTINGSGSATLPITNMSLDFISDGSNWHVE